MSHTKLIFVVTLVATLWYAALIDTAAVRSEEFLEQLQRVVHDTSPENVRTVRGTEHTGLIPSKRICYASMPCGWAVYTPATRRVNYFMKNTCECPTPNYKCIRSDDDLSVSAYVYRCRQNTTADDIESPEDAN